MPSRPHQTPTSLSTVFALGVLSGLTANALFTFVVYVLSTLS